MGMSSEFVLGMHGEIQFDGKPLAGMYPHEQVKVVEAAGDIAELVARSPRVQVVVTSRRPLKICCPNR